MKSNFAPLDSSWYEIGPDLGPGVPAYAYFWERDRCVDDGHEHAWESVLLPASQGNLVAEVVRCGVCLCPCCANIRDETPCTQRRAHAGPHKAPDGQTWAVGMSPLWRRS